MARTRMFTDGQTDRRTGKQSFLCGTRRPDLIRGHSQKFVDKGHIFFLFFIQTARYYDIL